MKKMLLWATGIVVATLVVYGFIAIHFVSGWSDRGNFGDMFGALNTLFSGCAFAGLIIALWSQQNELKLQREQLELQKEELKLTRTELQRSADAQEKSQQALLRQASSAELEVELTTMNNLLNFYTQQRSRIPFWTSGSPEETAINDLDARRNNLLLRMNSVYDEFVKQKNAEHVSPAPSQER